MNLSEYLNLAAVEPYNVRDTVVDFFVKWIELAIVDKYKQDNKQVFVASKGNEQLILTNYFVQYPHGLHPHVNIVWIKDGEAEVIKQDIVDDKFGHIKHSTGYLWGEGVESVWLALIKRSDVN